MTTDDWDHPSSYNTMAVTKGTLREQRAEEGGEARMTLDSVRKAESSI